MLRRSHRQSIVKSYTPKYLSHSAIYMQVMEQETFFSEKSSFANKNYRKYGTTTHNNLKHNSNSEVLIRHDLSKTDTLQGISIQYGCAVSFGDKNKDPERDFPIWIRNLNDNKLYDSVVYMLTPIITFTHFLQIFVLLFVDGTYQENEQAMAKRQLIFEAIPDDSCW